MYQEEECEGSNYIFNVNNQDDLICCINGGLGRSELQALLNECSEKNCDHFLYGENYPTATLITDVWTAIASNALELATYVVAYPNCETYYALYCMYVTDAILTECDSRYTNIRNYVD
jgi:NAD(P)H-flavin reductase